jgi:hypothetical protein
LYDPNKSAFLCVAELTQLSPGNEYDHHQRRRCESGSRSGLEQPPAQEYHDKSPVYHQTKREKKDFVHETINKPGNYPL